MAGGDGKSLKRLVNYVMSHAGTLALVPALGYVAVSAVPFAISSECINGMQQRWHRRRQRSLILGITMIGTNGAEQQHAA